MASQWAESGENQSPQMCQKQFRGACQSVQSLRPILNSRQVPSYPGWPRGTQLVIPHPVAQQVVHAFSQVTSVRQMGTRVLSKISGDLSKSKAMS